MVQLSIAFPLLEQPTDGEVGHHDGDRLLIPESFGPVLDADISMDAVLLLCILKTDERISSMATRGEAELIDERRWTFLSSVISSGYPHC
jgi:hypothetical protein